MNIRSLKFKLTLSYMLVALLLVATISFFSNFILQKQFEEYVIREQNRKNEEAVAMVDQLYDIESGSYDLDELERIGMIALENGMILKVTHSTGAVVWDAMVHNHGLCVAMLESMAVSMERRYRNFEGAYVEKEYILSADTMGSVTVGYYGPFYYTDNDSLFLDALNRVLMLIGVFSLAGAFLFGLYMARRISKPLKYAVDATVRIADGDYAVRVDDHGDTTEFTQLTSAVNSLAQKLSEQDALRKRLTADVAHELRTPLSSLQGHVEAFLDDVWQPDHEHLTTCHQEILRVNRLIDSLERLANLEDGSVSLDKTSFNLKELVQIVSTSFQSTLLKKNIQIEVTGDEIMILADRDKISQVFANLLSNSLRHTRADDHISIHVTCADKLARILFQDTGEGIAAEHLPYIFERFYRADSSRSKRSGGGGIGLAIVRAIVEMHDGKITVKSNPDQGTEFAIELPLK